MSGIAITSFLALAAVFVALGCIVVVAWLGRGR